MTWRGFILGLLLGVGVCATTYFNDWVIQQTHLVGNHLPISVFGVAVAVVLLLSPPLAALRRRWAITASEVATMVVMALAVCGWAGSGFMRYFAADQVMPAYWYSHKTAWQGANVMSYVPGGSWQLGEGHVKDWPGLCRELAGPAQPGGAGVSEGVGGASGAPLSKALWAALPADDQRVVSEVASTGRATPQQRKQILTALNKLLDNPGLFPVAALGALDLPALAREVLRQRAAGPEKALSADQIESLNRTALVATYPQYFLPRPEGQGVLLLGGRTDPHVTDELRQGAPGNTRISLTKIPWWAWMPSIELWGGLALLLSLAMLCIGLVVHPQWSRRELLAYPISRFIEELTAPPAPGSQNAGTASTRGEHGDSAGTARGIRASLPAILGSKLFWIGFAAVMVMHLVNGLGVWDSHFFFKINREFNFGSLMPLFPNINKASQSWSVFYPPWIKIFPMVIAFAFFLTTDVSLSLGLSMILWVAFSSLFVSYGISMDSDWGGVNIGQLMAFGSYLGFALTILYVGRRHYLDVVRAALGWERNAETPRYSVWGARCLVVLSAGAVALLVYGGLDWALAIPLVGIILLMNLVMARVSAETGCFFFQCNFMPMAMLVALCGIDAIGPTAYVILAVGSYMIVPDSREILMPFLINGLQIAERVIRPRSRPRLSAPLPESAFDAGNKAFGVSTEADSRAEAAPDARSGLSGAIPWSMALMLALGLSVAMFVTLYVQYNKGLSPHDSYATNTPPQVPFDKLSGYLQDLSSGNTLERSMRVHGWARLAAMRPTPSMLPWIALGAGLVLLFAMARLRLPWWPLHPVLFVYWGTWATWTFWFSFLIGWAVKVSVTRLGGAKGYHAVKPLMIGVISGELLAGLGWVIVGVVYYLVTNNNPHPYTIFPN